MNRILFSLIAVTISFLCGATTVSAIPASPTISYTTNGLDLTVSWTSVPDATGYLLSYAPFPYTGEDSIGSLDMMEATEFPITLWEGASYYIAVQAYDDQGMSPYSNIDLFEISLATEFVSGATYGTVSLIAEAITFTTFTSQEAEVEIGAINVPFVRNSSTYRFANILVDLDANGSFGPYPVFDGMQNEWVVKNVPLLAYSPSYNFLVDLIDPSVVKGNALDVRVILTNGPLENTDKWSGGIPDGAVARDMTVTTKETEWNSNATPDETSIGSGGGQTTLPKIPRSPGDVPAKDESVVDGTLYRAGMPDGNQGLNQCVSQSIANNLSWLSRRYNFTDKLDKAFDVRDEFGDEIYPDEQDKDYSTTEGVTNLSDIINETYNGLGLYNRNIGVPGTPGAQSFAEALPGLKENILKGKDKFVADHQLPIESSIISVGANSNLFAEIKKAMQNDECAVEVVLEIIDENNQTIGGHAVTVSGFADFQLGGSNYKGLTIHDGDSPNEESNNPGNDVYPLNGDTIDKFPFTGKDGKRKLYKAKLSFAIKQCYKPVEVSCLDSFSGMHNFIATSKDDSANHYDHTGNPLSSPLTIAGTGGSQVSVTGSSPFVNVTGNVIQSGGGCYLTATGSGTVAGFSNVSVMMDLSASSGNISGSYQMGSNGELFGVPITFNIEAQ